MKKKIIISILVCVVIAFGNTAIYLNSDDKETSSKTASAKQKEEPATKQAVKEDNTTSETVSDESVSAEAVVSETTFEAVESYTDENGVTYQQPGSSVEGVAQTWEEYQAKMESNSITVGDMKKTK